jgi:hypothetical protein
MWLQLMAAFGPTHALMQNSLYARNSVLLVKLLDIFQNARTRASPFVELLICSEDIAENKTTGGITVSLYEDLSISNGR